MFASQNKNDLQQRKEIIGLGKGLNKDSFYDYYYNSLKAHPLKEL